MLYQLTQGQLAHLLLPVGDYDKPAIRESARQAGLLNAGKADSQDICFVPDGDYTAFLQEYGHVTLEPGNFVDREGRVLGRHRGLPCYTTGQRKGLGCPPGSTSMWCGKTPGTTPFCWGMTGTCSPAASPPAG